MKRINFLILFLIGLFALPSYGQVTKTNSTAGTINGSQATRTVVFTSGDLGGCTSLTDVDVAINWQGGAFQAVEQLALSIQSPTGTTVHLVYDTQGTLTGNIGQFPTYYAGGFASWGLVTTTYDDDAGAPIPAGSVPAAGSWLPQEALSAFDGEDATGTWTITVSDHTNNGFLDDLTFNSISVIVSCGPACTDPTVPTVTSTPTSICAGNSATLFISGTLNDATQWAIYTGSCGGTLLGTTATSSFVVTPGATTTYFVRGEGGCVTPGSCGTVSVTVNPLDNASFNYGAAAYCVNAADPTPTITGLAGGTFSSSPAGLSINTGTGTIDVSASTPGTYTVTYTTAGSCPNSSNVSVTVNGVDDASFSYSASAYCVDGIDPTSTITGLAGGTFSSTAGLSINAATGTIDVSLSTPGTYTVTYTTSGACPNTSNVSVEISLGAVSAVCQDINVYLDGSGNATISAANVDGGSFATCGVLALSVSETAYSCANVSAGVTPLNDLVITGVYDGPLPGGTPKGVELYVIRDIADLSMYGIGSANNGGGTDGVEFTFPAVSVTAGSYIYVASEAVEFANYFGFAPDYTSGSMAINGDDAIELFYLGSVIDVFGDINVDGSGEVWDYLDGWAYRMDNTGTDGSAFTVSNWIYSGIDAMDGETSNATAVTPFPIGSYSILLPTPTQVTLYAEDGLGNIDSCIANLTVLDTISPLAVCQNVTAFLDGSGTAIVFAGDVDGGSSDNCGIAGLSSSPAVFNCSNIGANNVNFTVTDVNGNTSSCTAVVTIADTTSPTAVCQNINAYLNAAGNVTIVAADLDGGSTDNCGAVTLSASTTAFTCANTGPNNVTLTATDASGNSATCVSVVTVLDTISPLAVCQNVTAFLDGSGTAIVFAGDVDGGSSDNCGIAGLSSSPAVFNCSNIGANNVNLTVTDVNGNTSSCTGVVTIADTTSPTASCQNITVFLDGAGTASIVAADLDNGSTDNCGGVTLSASTTAFTCADLGPNTVTLTATDGSGNTSTCTSTVTVADTVSPTASCQNIIVFLDGAGNASITAADLDNGSTDNCGGVTLAASTTAFTCADIGPNAVTLTVTDGSGNTATCTSTVTVADTTSPTASCQNITVFLDGAGNASIVAADLDNGSTDNCGGVTLAASATAFTCADIGPNSVTLTVTDGSGNTATCASTVTVADTVSPTASCQNITVFLDGAGNASIVAADLDNGSTDNCGGVTLAASTTAFTCADIGPNAVTLTVTDGSGNTATCASTVTVADTISPVVTCPGNQVEVAGATCDFTLPDYTGLASGTDNCGASPTITQSPIAGTVINANTTITMTVDDGNGNTSTCTFDVILDFSACQGAECTNAIALAPMAPCGDTQVESGSTVGGTPSTEAFCGTSLGSGGANWYTFTGDGLNWTASTLGGGTNYDSKLWVYEGTCGSLTCVTGNDDFGGTAQSQVSFATTIGSTYYVVVGGYSSSEGNYDVTFTSVETTAPVADVAVLSDINEVCEVTSLTAPTATDNCSAVTVTNDATLPITSSSVITWTYTDASGNSSTQTQNVVLNDAIAPTASNPDTLYFECIADAIIDETVVDDEVDNCSGAITVTFVADVVSGNGCQDTITRTYNVEDQSGNSIDVTQIIIIEDLTAPTASNPLTLVVQCAADVPAPSTGWVTDEADNCSTPTVTFAGDVSDGQSCPETVSRTFNVTDACGNMTSVVQLIVINDTEAPVLDAASLATVTGFCDVAPTAPTASDNCAGVIDGVADVTFPINTLGTTVVTWTFTDDCGNSVTQTQNVTIQQINVNTTFASDGITIVSSNNTPGVTYQWLDCNADTLMTGATNKNFTPTYSSDFAVIVTQDGCTDTSACVTITEVSIDELKFEAFTMYPNPTQTGMFTINLDAELKEVSVIDMLGRKVIVGTDLDAKTIDGSALMNGAYIVRITTQNDQQMVGTITVQQ